MIDLTGCIFGRWTVLSYAGRLNRNTVWNCRCSCGTEKLVYGGNLRSKKSCSCGCLFTELAIERNTTHGMYRTPTYISWVSMKNRCFNEKSPDYSHYGGRGITVCGRWIHSFENFLEDMEKRPEGTSIDRIDVNGNYEPSNCRWAPPDIQNGNKRR